MTFDGVEIKIEKKNIKNIHLVVYPPDGRVRCSVPFYLPENELITFLSSRIVWIKSKQKEIVEKHKKNTREFISGETHYLFGKPFILEIITSRETPKIEIDTTTLKMTVSPSMQKAQRAGFLFNFYKPELHLRISSMIEKWLSTMKEDKASVTWSIDTMRRQWGKCFPYKRNIVLNLMLARVPLQCVEYVLVHELVHLKIHGHGKDFKAAMDYYLPDWRSRKKVLNSFPSLL